MGTNSRIKWKQLQWSALLLSLVLVFAQTVVQQHIHAADASAENCVVCMQGDSSPATASTTACPVELLTHEQLETSLTPPACQSSAAAYLSRAPPNA